jgi:hypothetical protein
MSEEPRRAGLLLRTAAKILDLILIAAVIEVIPKAGLLAGLAYLLLGDGLFDGRSLGKQLIGLQVISVDTQRTCTFRESLLRNSTMGFGYAFLLIPWIGWIVFPAIAAVEFILILGSKESRRLGDDIAGTSVIER